MVSDLPLHKEKETGIYKALVTSGDSGVYVSIGP
jgi:hypothetical protein